MTVRCKMLKIAVQTSKMQLTNHSKILPIAHRLQRVRMAVNAALRIHDHEVRSTLPPLTSTSGHDCTRLGMLESMGFS